MRAIFLFLSACHAPRIAAFRGDNALSRPNVATSRPLLTRRNGKKANSNGPIYGPMNGPRKRLNEIRVQCKSHQRADIVFRVCRALGNSQPSSSICLHVIYTCNNYQLQRLLSHAKPRTLGELVQSVSRFYAISHFAPENVEGMVCVRVRMRAGILGRAEHPSLRVQCKPNVFNDRERTSNSHSIRILKLLRLLWLV